MAIEGKRESIRTRTATPGLEVLAHSFDAPSSSLVVQTGAPAPDYRKEGDGGAGHVTTGLTAADSDPNAADPAAARRIPSARYGRLALHWTSTSGSVDGIDVWVEAGKDAGGTEIGWLKVAEGLTPGKLEEIIVNVGQRPAFIQITGVTALVGGIIRVARLG